MLLRITKMHVGFQSRLRTTSAWIAGLFAAPRCPARPRYC